METDRIEPHGAIEAQARRRTKCEYASCCSLHQVYATSRFKSLMSYCAYWLDSSLLRHDRQQTCYDLWNTGTARKAFNEAEDESRKIWTFESPFTVDQKGKRNPITVPKGSDLTAFTVGTPAGWRFLMQGTKGSLRIMEHLQSPNCKPSL
jgi:hypothetical protein